MVTVVSLQLNILLLAVMARTALALSGGRGREGAVSFTKRVKSSAMVCPGSPASSHAGMKLTTIADTTCSAVAEEAKARVAGEGGWVDPHNKGTYSVANYGGDMSFTRLTGDKKYTDAMVFTLTPVDGKCQIEACSESQGPSNLDFSTNYCNLLMLFCGTGDGCDPVLNDFTHGAENLVPMAGASSKKADCFNGPQAR